MINNLYFQENLHNLIKKYPNTNIIISYKNIILPKQPKDKYYGNREYKKHLNLQIKKNINTIMKLEQRSTQLLFRLSEGNGKAIYLIGVCDDGNTIGISKEEMIISIDNVLKMCNIINCNIHKINIYLSKNNKYICSIRYIKTVDYELS